MGDPTSSQPEGQEMTQIPKSYEWKRFGNLNLDQNIEIKAKNINYFVELPNPQGKGTVRKQILHSVSLKAPPGKLIALMGPTGCGKTTFISILSSRTRHNVSGTLLFNKTKSSTGIRRLIAYVLQQDLLFPNLTVRETITFMARLRLPNSISYEDKIQRVDELIHELGLDKCRDTIIGGAFVRGVSGGEKKRVCIGCELIVNPPVCLLDEPTTGLDASTAFSLLKTLKRLAESGRTVVASIHQPSSQMFNYFDHVLFLCDGNTIFNGPPNNVVDYLSNVGYICPDSYNPADYLMELLVEDPEAKKQLIQANKDYARNRRSTSTFLRSTTENEINKDNVDEKNENGKEQELEDAFLDESEDEIADENGLLVGGKHKFPISWTEQVIILSQRHWIEFKAELKNRYQYYQLLALAFVIGFVWFQIGHEETDISPRVAVLWWEGAFLSFIPAMASVTGMLGIQPMLIKDRGSGIYPLSSWLVAKAGVELVADLIIPTVFFHATYWLVGYSTNASSIFFNWFLMCFLSLIQRTAGFTIYALRLQMKEAFVILSSYIILNMSAVGFLMDLDKVKPWVSWIKYVSVNRYFFQVL